MAGYWVLVTSARNLSICHDLGLWGDLQAARIRRLRPGDNVAFYVRSNWKGERTRLPGGGRPKGRQIAGTAIVLGLPYRAREQYWPDRFYPNVVDIEWTSAYPPNQYIDCRCDASGLCARQGDFMLDGHATHFDRWATMLGASSPGRGTNFDPAVGIVRDRSTVVLGDGKELVMGVDVQLSSPVGQALLGRQAGETVEVSTPGGVRELHIREVRDS